jgi:hypothetical protein
MYVASLFITHPSPCVCARACVCVLALSCQYGYALSVGPIWASVVLQQSVVAVVRVRTLGLFKEDEYVRRPTTVAAARVRLTRFVCSCRDAHDSEGIHDDKDGYGWQPTPAVARGQRPGRRRGLRPCRLDKRQRLPRWRRTGDQPDGGGVVTMTESGRPIRG